MRTSVAKKCEKCGNIYYEMEGGIVSTIDWNKKNICPQCKGKKAKEFIEK